MEILLGYAIFWFIDRSVRQLGHDIRDEYRKVTGRFAGKRAEKHPDGGRPPVTWRIGVKTAAVLGAGTVGTARGTHHFATGFSDRWRESRRLAKANRDETRRLNVQHPDDTVPGAPRRLSKPLPDRAPAGDACPVPGCTLPPLPSTGHCFVHSDDEARVGWLNDHEPAPKVNLTKQASDAEPAGGGPFTPHPVETNNPFNTTNPGGTVTEAVNYGQMIASCESHIEEATAETESAKHGQRQANMAMEDARASLRLADEETTRIEAEAATLASLHAPAELTSAVAALQDACGQQKKAAESRMAAAEQQQSAATERLTAAENKHTAANTLLSELRRLQNVVEAIDSLGGPDKVPDNQFLTHG